MRRLLPIAIVVLAGCTEESEVHETPKIDADGLVVTLEVEGSFVAGEKMPVTMIVTNPTESPRTFCRYHTPFEGIRNDIFAVSASIQDVPYRGMMAKRAPPGPEDFVRVAPKTSVRATVDLADGYEIPEGGYALSYRGTDISGLPFAGPVSVSVRAPK